MTEKFTKLLDIIDADWIEEDPGTAMELIEALISDVRHYKEVVEMQRELLLLTQALLESKNEPIDDKKREALKTLGRIS